MKFKNPIYKHTKKCFGAVALSLLFFSCNGGENNTQQQQNQPQQQQQQTFKQPEFNADSAYQFIKKQVEFGPRVPGSKAHENCAQYLFSKLKQYTPNVEIQTGTVQRYDGKQLNIKNIIAKFGPENTNRILLCAHWDTRPWADQEEDKEKQKLSIDGANDGGSGVGVLLEMARQFSLKSPEVGVTILLVDAEDQGAPSFEPENKNADDYCLGTQFWAKNLDKTKYTASFGIVLDMVGARNARFQQEYYSMQFAPGILQNVWKHAYLQGFSNYFINNMAPPAIDDHYYINKLAQIPTIDIIDYDGSRAKGFGDYWHTTEDNMHVIDRATLDAVGKTVLSVILNEKPQPL